jgi:hypothetical protein
MLMVRRWRCSPPSVDRRALAAAAAARRRKGRPPKKRLRAIVPAPQQFRYQPGTGRFEIAPQISAASTEPDPDVTPTERSARNAPPDDWAGDLEALAAKTSRRDLPDGVSFCPMPTDATADKRSPAGPAGRESSSTSDDEWSAPIVFQPNGRTSNARIRLFGEGKFSIDVILRGLTGVAIANELARDEELR